MLYGIKGKDPIIEVLRNVIETRAQIEGISFGKVVRKIERETKGEVKYQTLYGWFEGATKCPQYCNVARLYIALRQYINRSIEIGEREDKVVSLAERRKRVA